MGLPPSQLGPNEQIVIETREHWKHLLGAMLICLLAIAGVVAVQLLAPTEGFWVWLSTAGWVASRSSCSCSASGRGSSG